ncbi:electron transport complex subunit G, partial [Citrobacter sp. AAK_AS5]
MKTMIKLSFVMAAYAVVACVGLAVVYRITAPRIEAAA